MKRTIYDCWNCRHSNSDNRYGIDYCEVRNTRCSFAYDDCEDFEPTADGEACHSDLPRRLTVIGWYVLTLIAAAQLGWLLMGCTTTKYIPVTETRTEHHWHTDSVRERDSTHTEREIVIREVDSAAMTRYGIQMQANQRAWLVLQREMENRLRDLEHMTAKRDTVRDSIPVPYPVEKPVPAQLTWWQRVRLCLSNVLLLVVVIIFGYVVVRRKVLKGR